MTGKSTPTGLDALPEAESHGNLGRLLLNGARGPGSSSATQSATFKIGPLGVSTFVLSRALRRLQRSNIRENSTGKMGRVRDLISLRGEGMGSLECRRAVPQWLRFRQDSVPAYYQEMSDLISLRGEGMGSLECCSAVAEVSTRQCTRRCRRPFGLRLQRTGAQVY